MDGCFSYSFDRETFHGNSDTRQDALKNALEKLNELSDSPEMIYVGKRVPIDPGASGLSELVISAMRRRVHDEIGGNEREYLMRINEHQLADLDENLSRIITGWLERYKLAPSHVKITAISEHPVPHPSMARSE